MRKSFCDILVLRADCHCLNCSENNECLSKGHCQDGYRGDDCMLHDIINEHKELKIFTFHKNGTEQVRVKCTAE